MDNFVTIFQIVEQLVPFLIILLGFVLLAISIWGIVIYVRQLPAAGQKNQPKSRLK